MKCPQCEAWTDVLETRAPFRRRECANGHKFITKEDIHEGTGIPRSRRKPHARKINYLRQTNRRKVDVEDSGSV